MKKFNKEERLLRKKLGITNKTPLKEALEKIASAYVAIIVADHVQGIIDKELKKSDKFIRDLAK